MEKIEKTDQLPIDDQQRLRVHLVPMPSGDNPWRTQGDYQKERHREDVRFYIVVVSFVLTIMAATLSWVQMLEARKERIKAEEALKSTKEIAQLLVNLGEVDYGVGYTINSFKVREIAAPYLYAKLKDIAKSLGIPVDDKVNIAFNKWASLERGDPAKEKALKELENIIIEKLSK